MDFMKNIPWIWTFHCARNISDAEDTLGLRPHFLTAAYPGGEKGHYCNQNNQASNTKRFLLDSSLPLPTRVLWCPQGIWSAVCPHSFSKWLRKSAQKNLKVKLLDFIPSLSRLPSWLPDSSELWFPVKRLLWAKSWGVPKSKGRLCSYKWEPPS